MRWKPPYDSDWECVFTLNMAGSETGQWRGLVASSRDHRMTKGTLGGVAGGFDGVVVDEHSIPLCWSTEA